MWKNFGFGIFVFFIGLSGANASADLSISKMTSVGFEKSIERFEELEITINYSNAGPDAAENITLEDPYNNIYGMVWGLPENCENLGSKIHCQIGTLNSGEKGEIKYSAQIAGGAPTGMTTTYANITATINKVAFETSAATRFRVIESSRPRYFYYSFSTSDSSNRYEEETVLDRMADNVRLATTTRDEEEQEEEDTEETSETTRTPLPETRDTFVFYVPPSGQSVSHSTNPTVSYISSLPATRLPSSGSSSSILLVIFSLLSAFLLRRKNFFQK